MQNELNVVDLYCMCFTNLKPECSFKSINVDKKCGVFLRTKGVLAMVKLGSEVVTRVFLDHNSLSVALRLYKQTHPHNDPTHLSFTRDKLTGETSHTYFVSW